MNNTLANGLRIITLLADADRDVGVREIARRLELGVSQVHGLLQTMGEAGFVRQSAESRKYGLTLKLWILGSGVVDRWDLKQVGIAHLRNLAHQTGDTVHLSVLDGENVLYVDKIESQQPIRAYTRVGGHAPAYCVSTGKAMLAFTPDAIDTFSESGLTRYTTRTITTLASLMKEMEKIREAGCAVNMGEWREDVRGVAAPVYNARGDVVCAIGVTAPATRLTVARLPWYSATVMQAANAMSIDMGMSVQPTRKQSTGT